MSAPTVTAVTEASPAARAGLSVGDELVSLNGRVPRDVIEFQQLSDAEDVRLVVRRHGVELARPVRVSKQAGEPLGVAVSSAVFDRIRTCDNHCAFCFIYQLPKGMRRSLYLKDDDYRLSFLYGNFTTLTRFTELDAERVLTERLGPLFVSIHATDPEVRARMLRNPKGATSLRWLRVLLAGGIEVHGQVVVCPGVNDGDVLVDTLAGILDEYPTLASVGVVPLGLSRFSSEPEMRRHSSTEAAAVCDSVARWQEVFASVLGRRTVYAADEYYLLAGRPFPQLEAYDDLPQHENGIGICAAFAQAFGAGDAPAVPGGVRHGFFAAVDAAPAEGYRAPRTSLRLLPGPGQPGRTGPDERPVAVLTGAYGARVLAPLLEGHPRGDVRLVAVPNDFFGGNIAVAGLLTGQDVSAALGAQPEGTRYLLPDACLSEGRFLDGLSLADLPRPVEVLPTDGRSLRQALDGRSFLPGVLAVSDLPLVVVAGRPNVGKSSLVNRIVGRRAAVVEEERGVTRDRKVLEAEWVGTPFRIMDTGGWLAGGDALEAKVSKQAEQALAEADVVLLVVDVTVGVTDEDLAAARVIRRAGAPVVLVVNKVDGETRHHAIWEFVSLGVGDPYPVSALHGRGTGDMLDEVVRLLRLAEAEQAAADGAAVDGVPAAGPEGSVPRVAIIGRPNVGKSTLFNRLIGEERSIVHDMPGTTRDAIDTVVTTPDGPLCFIDTAGLRRPSKTDRGTEHHSVLRALDALERADIALLVIDATVGATHQDQRLAERIGISGSPSVVVLNKWDLIDTEERQDILDTVGEKLAFLGTAPVLKVSAISGRGANKILPALHEAVTAYHQRVPTGALNRALRDIQLAQPAPRARIRYGVQGGIDPPTFTLFATGRLHHTYLRYIERGLREHFDLGPTPIVLRVRTGGR